MNYLNVNASLQATNAVNDDCPVNAGVFATGETNPLKVLTSKFLGNGWVRLVMKPHLEAFHTGTVLVPGIEIRLRIKFNSPEFFCLVQGWRTKNSQPWVRMISKPNIISVG